MSLKLVTNSALSRQMLLETCFADIPQKLAGFDLRRFSAASFALLTRLGSPMLTSTSSEKTTLEEMLDGVILYIWVHSAALEKVIAIETVADLPADEIKKMGYELEMGAALAFLRTYQSCSNKMAAALAEVEEEDDTEGKLSREQSPAGSPPSSMPSEAAPILPGNDTSCGSSPSNEPSATSTPQMPQTGSDADGSILPDLRTLEIQEQTSN